MKTNSQQVTCSRRQLDLVLADVHTLGYYALPDEERAIADAFDKGTLIVKEGGL